MEKKKYYHYLQNQCLLITTACYIFNLNYNQFTLIPKYALIIFSRA